MTAAFVVLVAIAVAIPALAQQDPKKPAPATSAQPTTDLSAGGVLYRANCAACHHAAGAGGALSYSENAPSLDGTHPIKVAVAVRGGPGNMPVFGPDQLSDEELGQLVTYVQFLQDPGAPGGAPIGNVGPVSEGLVGLAVGALAILLAMRWMERRDA